MKNMRSLVITIGLLVSIFGQSACSQQDKAQKHLETANKLFAEGDYATAEIEYKNALQINSSILEAAGNLGVIYFEEGRIRQAYPFLNRARDVAPENVHYREKLAALLLDGGEAASAWDEAVFILDKDPSNSIAPLVLQGAAARLNRLVDAKTILDPLRGTIDNPAIDVALAMLDAIAGNLDLTKAKLEEITANKPDFAEAYIALAGINQAQGNIEAAESAYAEASRVSGGRPNLKIRYARFKAQMNDPENALALLNEILETRPRFAPALLEKARVLAEKSEFDSAKAIIDELFILTPYNPQLFELNASTLLSMGNTAEAIKSLERGIELYPNLYSLHYQMAQAHLASNDSIKAAASLAQTLTLAPNHPQATLLQAGMNAREGNPEDAIVSLERFLANDPENVQAQSLLAQIHVEAGNFEAALGIYKKLSEQLPSNPQPPQLAADVLLRMGKLPEARGFLEASLSRNPQYLAAFERISDLDIAEKKFSDALLRIDEQLADFPESDILWFLRGKVSLASGDLESGESELKKATEIQPTLRSAQFLLARYYLSKNEDEKALERLESILETNPKDTETLLNISTIFDKRGEISSSKAALEKILEIDPNHAEALNNIAFILSEDSHEIEKAFEYAMRARELRPSDPSVADTLGWINYKRGEYDWALGLINESAKQLGEIAEVQYHLAKIQEARGELEEAREAAQKALKLGLSGENEDDARSILE